jgi:hypothetical protein
MAKSTVLLAILGVACAASLGAAQLEEVSGAPSTWTFTVPAPPDVAIKLILDGAQDLGLIPASVDRDLQLVKFEPRTLTAEELDKYCDYPVIWKFNRQPVDTFTKWNQRSGRKGAGAVRGTLVLFVRYAGEEGGGTRLTATATFTGGNSNESHTLNSKRRTFEVAFQQGVISKAPK